MVTAKNSASFPLNKKILLFDDLLKNDCALFLYDQGVDVHDSFYSFIENGLASGELCLYAYDQTSNKLQLDRAFGKAAAEGRLWQSALGRTYLLKEIEELDLKFRKLYRKVRSEGCPVRVLVDFGGLVTHYSFDKAIDLVRNITAKRKETLFSRQLRGRQPFPQTAITAFNFDSLDEDEIKALIGLHENVVISSRNGITTLALNFRTRKPFEPGIEVAPKEVLEEFVKRHLETIVLLLLRERQMCGYDVIKTIYQRYHTFLSQGTVYPLLYSLKEEGLLAMSKEEGERSKVYTFTEEGKRAADRKIDDFVRAQRYLLESIRK